MAIDSTDPTGLASLHARALRQLETELQLLEHQSQGGVYNEDRAAMAANLARSIATLSAEVRKHETHAAKVVAQMGDQERDRLIHAYVGEMPRERRDALRQLLDRLDSSERSVLR